MNDLQPVHGSITAVARQKGMSPALFVQQQARAGQLVIVCVDTSASMAEKDASIGDGDKRRKVSRNEAAQHEAERLQRDYPGQVLIVSWSSDARMCLDGHIEILDGGTSLMAALEIVEDFDGFPVPVFILSDGDVVDEDESIEWAMKHTIKLNTIFIGDREEPESRNAMSFLKRLAKVGRGKSATSVEPGKLAAPIVAMLPSPSTSKTIQL